MRPHLTLTLVLAAATLTADLAAQRGGDRRNRWRQPEEITNRVGLFFRDIDGPQEDGDKVADLATVELVRAASAANQLAVLYLVDRQDESAELARGIFEWTLGRDQELGIQLRCFHCGRIDLHKSPALKARYEKDRPLFVVFDADGEPTEVAMAGYRAAGSKLRKALERAAAGTMRPSLSRFAKDYGKLVKDYAELLSDRGAAQQDLNENRDDRSKVRKAEKELVKIAKAEAKLLEKETELLGKLTLPERGDQRVGGFRPRRDRGGEGGKDGGKDDGTGGGERGGRGRRGGGE